MPRISFAALVAVLTLAVPGAAFAQGAGDDEYQDPFPETTAQTEPGDDGLSDEPPVPDDQPDADDDGGDSGPAGDPDEGDQTPTQATPRADLPNTGSDPVWLALAGLSFLLIGAGLRLRTIDPNDF